MNGSRLAMLSLALGLGCRFGGGPELSPEDFALNVVRAVVMNDFGAYLPLCDRGSDAVASHGARGLATTLESLESARIRADFDRVVRSHRLSSGALNAYRVELRAEEHERWVFEVVDMQGRSTQLQVAVRQFGDSYRVVGLNLL